MIYNPRMARRYWLIKSEPFKYSWDRFVSDGKTFWDGVRNYEARNNLRAMGVGDLALFYHSNEGRQVVGVARVVRAAYAGSDQRGGLERGRLRAGQAALRAGDAGDDQDRREADAHGAGAALAALGGSPSSRRSSSAC